MAPGDWMQKSAFSDGLSGKDSCLYFFFPGAFAMDLKDLIQKSLEALPLVESLTKKDKRDTNI